MGAVRARIEVRGRVQGVGFRPFVYRLARELRLGGSVANNPCGVSIEVEGAAADVETFERRLTAELPPLAVIERVTAARYEAIGQTAFRILPSPVAVDSGNGRVQEAHISPDVAVCADCLREVRNPTDRRHGYPFTNCTNCGPRYSIIHGVPYDRPNTTMSRFVMCAACQAEYDHPADRRFHAQPNACPDCGPRLSLVTPDGSQIGGNAVVRAAAALRRGAIVAIKGVGGFHLACRADHDAAVRRLRERKHRETKPLAIMVPDLAAARRICEVTDGDAALLESPEAPIVLMPKGADQNPSPPWGRGQGEGENRANPTLPRPLPGREGGYVRRFEVRGSGRTLSRACVGSERRAFDRHCHACLRESPLGVCLLAARPSGHGDRRRIIRANRRPPLPRACVPPVEPGAPARVKRWAAPVSAPRYRDWGGMLWTDELTLEPSESGPRTRAMCRCSLRSSRSWRPTSGWLTR